MFRAFALPSKRERLVTVFGNPRRRKQALDDLNHADLWDPRYARPIDGWAASALEALRAAGAPATCHVISDSEDMDGREMVLEEAVEACEAFSFASIVCCIPGVLAFFWDEESTPRDRVLLYRPRERVAR